MPTVETVPGGVVPKAMLERLMALFASDRPETDAGADGDADALALAAAGLLVEAARLDENFAETERNAIRNVLVRNFDVDDAQAEALIAAADREDEGLYQITRTIRERLAPEERYQVLEMLWEVAYADGVLDDYEANLARRVAGLLYVSDQESGAARLRVLERLGLSDSNTNGPA